MDVFIFLGAIVVAFACSFIFTAEHDEIMWGCTLGLICTILVCIPFHLEGHNLPSSGIAPIVTLVAASICGGSIASLLPPTAPVKRWFAVKLVAVANIEPEAQARENEPDEEAQLEPEKEPTRRDHGEETQAQESPPEEPNNNNNNNKA